MANNCQARIDAICAEKGARRINKYVNAKAELHILCANEHDWQTTGGSILNKGSWCTCCSGLCSHPKCHNSKLDVICARKCGKRIGSYIDSTTKIEFECAAHHTFYAAPANVKFGKGTWCPCCAHACKHAKCYEDRLDKICREHGGWRLDPYKGKEAPMRIKCADPQHLIWTPTPHNLTQDHWCPECAGKSRNPAYHEKILDDICRGKGGKRLGDYINSDLHIKFQCALEHEWETVSGCIKNGRWCHECSPTYKNSATYQAALDEACAKLGVVRETPYVLSNKDVWFRCLKDPDHYWPATPNNFKNSKGCPYCQDSSEQECRRILETVLGRPFIRSRPEFLCYIKGRPLELDGYCPSLRLAFEFNGKQHYEFIDFFHDGDEANLIAQKERDKFKVMKAKEIGIDLIVISYEYKTFLEKVAFLKEKLERILEQRLYYEPDSEEATVPVGDDWWP